jgi:hypothetical protein
VSRTNMSTLRIVFGLVLEMATIPNVASPVWWEANTGNGSWTLNWKRQPDIPTGITPVFGDASVRSHWHYATALKMATWYTNWHNPSFWSHRHYNPPDTPGAGGLFTIRLSIVDTLQCLHNLDTLLVPWSTHHITMPTHQITMTTTMTTH